jgi:hypothetical protein
MDRKATKTSYSTPESSVSSNMNKSSIQTLLSSNIDLSKIQIPEFSGTPNEDSEIWIRKLEFLQQQYQRNNPELFSIIRNKLNGVAFRWFSGTIQSHLNTMTFEEFKQKFLTTFRPLGATGLERKRIYWFYL